MCFIQKIMVVLFMTVFNYPEIKTFYEKLYASRENTL